MTTLFYAEPELVVALNKRIVFVNPNDLQIFKEVELPADLRKCGLKVANSENVNNPDKVDDDSDKKKQEQEEVPCIKDVALSPNGQLLAVTTAGQKSLIIYQCYPVHAKLISVRPLARASSALAFGSDSKAVLVTDKTGDCYYYDCVDLDAAPRLLLGHLSIVYDVLWTPDSKYIITCDRDDKIRVTNYPSTYDIHGYCLGHKEFVAGLALIDKEVIASVSGDKTLRLWNFESGKQLAQIELPAPGIHLALSIGAKKLLVAVLLHQPNECVGIYEISKKSDGVWEIVESQVLSFPSMIVNNLCFAEKRLYVAGIVDDRFTLQVGKISEDTALAPENWLKMVEEQFLEEEWKPEDVSAWFKKRYDNVSDYMERKKRRIEEKQK